MWSRWWLPWLLGAAVAGLPECRRGSSPKSIRVSYTSVSEAGLRLPKFSAAGYVDDQLIACYESDTRKIHSRVSWMNTVEKDEPKFWDRYTRITQKDEKDFQENVQMLQRRYNQSGGFHIVQMMIFCEVWEDGSKRGHWQYGYDGRDFLSFNMETLRWTASDKEALETKRTWEKKTAIRQRFASYLESTCTELLQKDKDYGSGNCSREEPPVVTVSSKREANGLETLTCRAHGFYPKNIYATWRKDGEILENETQRGFLAPNSDKTFYTWLSIRVDPEEKYQYRCHVEHDALPKGILTAMKAPEFNLGLLIGCLVAVVVTIAVTAGIWVFLRLRQRRQGGS